MMDSYSASLLEAEKLRRMACSMTSLVGGLSCNPRSASVVKHHPHSSLVEESLLGNQAIPIPLMLGVD